MDLKELANNLRGLREGRGLSLSELEEISGVHRNTINGIETAKHKPRGSTLRKLSEALDADVEDLTGVGKGRSRSFQTFPPGDRESGVLTT
jgi:transcriptional regulator with XRE-family HTH domain